ncbi:type II toxin-antitoxin system VapC family toxin [Luteitalea pratensis]|uniref:type II toxin-antitoxin system VapC family toxin n=1 Tax=Luteitalea pratensis TaxID=1855912 RepID=UPI0012FF7F5C|nr:type II toxin-antitoxin system VapC family toxin [Luteitalea pratensis]
MSGYLLDTNVTLVALTEPARLTPRVRRAIKTGPNVLSVIVYWEVVLKAIKGALAIDHPQTWWPDELDQLAATALAFRPDHVSTVQTLSPIHKDPFDRALIAQAVVEQLTLLTTDREIPRYRSDQLQVIT